MFVVEGEIIRYSVMFYEGVEFVGFVRIFGGDVVFYVIVFVRFGLDWWCFWKIMVDV